jgi:WhiB family redox-sensing transcriptional regulator
MSPTGIRWRSRAACRGLDTEVFFPLHATRGPATPREAAAKRVCARCPVVAECLRFALRHGEDWGIWGGLSSHERRRLRSVHEAVAASQRSGWPPVRQ